jgi:hypothetical protein
MSDKEIKLCINCRWYKGSKTDPFYSRCAHISAKRKDWVTGEIWHSFCDSARLFGACGKDGLFFERAEPRENKQTSSNKIISKIFRLLGIR